jgi:rhodanese-related sulfurtransferase
VARHFLEQGYTKVYALKGGWNEWENANLPVEAK